MIEIGGLKACDTCRKALKSVMDAGMEGSLRDFRANPPSPQELRRWHDLFGPALLNTRSTTWRDLSPEARSGDPLDLMAAHPALIKRPVVVAGDTVLLGWTPETRAALGL